MFTIINDEKGEMLIFTPPLENETYEMWILSKEYLKYLEENDLLVLDVPASNETKRNIYSIPDDLYVQLNISFYVKSICSRNLELFKKQELSLTKFKIKGVKRIFLSYLYSPADTKYILEHRPYTQLHQFDFKHIRILHLTDNDQYMVWEHENRGTFIYEKLEDVFFLDETYAHLFWRGKMTIPAEIRELLQ
jgi:hypothetical protein